MWTLQVNDRTASFHTTLNTNYKITMEVCEVRKKKGWIHKEKRLTVFNDRKGQKYGVGD